MNRLFCLLKKRLWWSVLFSMLFCLPGIANASVITNLHDLRDFVSRGQNRVTAFDLSGTLLSVGNDSGAIFLQDDSGTEVLETQLTGLKLQPGQKIRIKGTNYITGTEGGISLGKQALVDADGLHTTIERKGSIFLKSGRHPFRLPWFNWTGSAFLTMAYEGPQIERQLIPAESFSRQDQTGQFFKGLNYRCVEGPWIWLPYFEKLVPTRTGTVSNLDLSVKSREEGVGIEFDGFLSVPTDGLYTFFVKSDDGARLFLEAIPPVVEVLGIVPLPPARQITVGQSLAGEKVALWAEVEGTVTFVCQHQESVELELASGETKMRVYVIAWDREIASLLHSRVRLRGICPEIKDSDGHPYAALLMVASWNDIQGESANREPVDTRQGQTNALPLLTTAIQVHQLKREAAQREYPVKLRGVATLMDPGFKSMVIQDPTRAVFVWIGENTPTNLPHIGDYCEVEGITRAADFSPIVVLKKTTLLWKGQLPRPLIPSHDQIINGSLDAQYVEIRGLVTAVRPNYVTILTADGVFAWEVSPTPAEGWEPFINSVVRMRGCLFANWDTQSHSLVLDQPMRLKAAAVSIEVPPLTNAFAVEKIAARELMQFNIHSDIFRWVKISGQILHRSADLYYMMDGATGLRFRTALPVVFEPGDHVEVVGLHEFEGSSPILRQALARKTGHSPIPSPRQLFIDKLNDNYDSTRVWLEGTLVEVKRHGAEQLIELQVGVKSFIARLPSKQELPSLTTGSRLRLTGVFCALDGNLGDLGGINSFELLLNSPEDVRVIALPPWWTLGRLLVTVAVLVVGLGLAFVWITSLRRQVERRTAQLKSEMSERQRAEKWRAIEEERSRIARDLHDDLGSQLTELGMLAVSPRLKLEPETAPGRLLEIAEKSRSMITALDRLVWVINSKNDTLSALAEYLASYFEEFLYKAEISCRVELPAPYTDRAIAAEIRNHVLLSVRETLNNAVRHGHPTEVLLRLTLEGNELEILVQDNGRGFDQSRSSSGNGLTNLRERFSKLNGNCQIKSTPKKGTSVLLRLPLPPANAPSEVSA